MWWGFLLFEIGPTLILYWGITYVLRTRRDIAASRRTHGSVLSVDEWVPRRGETRRYAVLEFTNSAGEKVETRSAHFMRESKKPGSPVTVRFLPRRPTTAWIEGEAEAEVARTLFVSLSIFIGFTVTMVWYILAGAPS